MTATTRATKRQRDSLAKLGARELQRLRQTLEVQVETRRPGQRTGRRTTIWVVTTEEGAFIRSYRGPRGRWYQEALEQGAALIHAERRRIPVRLVPDRRASTLRQVNAAYRRKYGSRFPSETAPMLRAGVARTTLRLEPAAGSSDGRRPA